MRSACPLGRHFYGRQLDREPFFGIGPADKEQLILEPIHLLIYYGGFTYTEAYNISVAQKRWHINRIVQELNKTSEDGSTQSRALHQNDPQTRSLQGRVRPSTPSRLRRFT